MTKKECIRYTIGLLVRREKMVIIPETAWIPCRKDPRAMSNLVTSAGIYTMFPTDRHTMKLYAVSCRRKEAKCLCIHERADLNPRFMYTELALNSDSLLTCLPSIVKAQLVCRIQGPVVQKLRRNGIYQFYMVWRRHWILKGLQALGGTGSRPSSVFEHHGNSFAEHRRTSRCRQTWAETSKNPHQHLPVITRHQCCVRVTSEPLPGLVSALQLLPPNRRYGHHFCQQSGAGIGKLWILLPVGQESSNNQLISIVSILYCRFHGVTARAVLRTDFFKGSSKRHDCGRVIMSLIWLNSTSIEMICSSLVVWRICCSTEILVAEFVSKKEMRYWFNYSM